MRISTPSFNIIILIKYAPALAEMVIGPWSGDRSFEEGLHLCFMYNFY